MTKNTTDTRSDFRASVSVAEILGAYAKQVAVTTARQQKAAEEEKKQNESRHSATFDMARLQGPRG
jgi:hypothetical protein